MFIVPSLFDKKYRTYSQSLYSLTYVLGFSTDFLEHFKIKL